MGNFKFYRLFWASVFSVLLSLLVVYLIQAGYVYTMSAAKMLLVLTGVAFISISIVGSLMIFRGRIPRVEQFRSVCYLAFVLLGVGGVLALWAGLPLDKLPRGWSTVGIYLAVLNLVLMFVIIPLCAYRLWRRGK